MRPRKNNTHRRDVLQRWARERHNNVAATRHDRAGVYQGPQRFNPAPVRERREHGRRVVCANVASGGQGSVRTWTTCPSHIVAHPAALVGQEGRRLMAGKRALCPHPTANWRARRDGTRVNASGPVQPRSDPHAHLPLTSTAWAQGDANTTIPAKGGNRGAVLCRKLLHRH